MSDMLFHQLQGCRSVSLCQSGSIEKLLYTLQQSGITLPAEHSQLLTNANGVMAYNGFYRLFGLGCSHCTDMRMWNDYDTWKFAWPCRATEFWCFGENAFGDQYAYMLSDLVKSTEPPVYYLEHVTLGSEVLADSFHSFIEQEFLRCALQPYYDFHMNAAAQFGTLLYTEHLAHAPSMLLSGQELLINVIKMDGVANMIINGDLASQLADEFIEREIQSVVPYVDANGRSRVKVIWR